MRIGRWQPHLDRKWIMPYRHKMPDFHVLDWAAGIGPFRLWYWAKEAE